MFSQMSRSRHQQLLGRMHKHGKGRAAEENRPLWFGLLYVCRGKGWRYPISQQSLLNLLESFDSFAGKFSAFEPGLRKYPDFKEVLILLSKASCEGCRGDRIVNPDCSISPCVKEKGYDFCFECQEFPCDKRDLDQKLREGWIKGSSRMIEIGVEAYFDEVKNRSHYL